MNAPILQFKTLTPLRLIVFALSCLALPRKAHAVSPPPDGGYPGGNTAEGQNALLSLTTGTYNTAVGLYSLLSLTDGKFNTGIGAGTLLANTADQNTATGAGALLSNTIGINNTAMGASALSNSISGTDNIALGFNAGNNVTTAGNVICIGANVAGNDVDNSCFIGNIFGATSSGGTALFVNSNGRLGTMTSSRRFKEEIKPMERASEALFALKPVTFRYKKEIDLAGTSQFGLVADEVEKVNPDLVVRDEEGTPYSVRYEAVNAMLLNEFLKEHRKVEKLEATITQLDKDFQAAMVRERAEMQAAVAQLNERVQKMSAQLEVSKPAPQTVSNSQ